MTRWWHPRRQSAGAQGTGRNMWRPRRRWCCRSFCTATPKVYHMYVDKWVVKSYSSSQFRNLSILPASVRLSTTFTHMQINDLSKAVPVCCPATQAHQCSFDFRKVQMISECNCYHLALLLAANVDDIPIPFQILVIVLSQKAKANIIYARLSHTHSLCVLLVCPENFFRLANIRFGGKRRALPRSREQFCVRSVCLYLKRYFNKHMQGKGQIFDIEILDTFLIMCTWASSSKTISTYYIFKSSSLW